MMLQALIAYAERNNLGDDGITEAVKVRWGIRLDQRGEFMGLLKLLENPDDKKPHPKTYFRPFTSANTLNHGDKSHFLCDTLERAVLFLDEKKPERNESRQIQHSYFKSMLHEAVQSGNAESARLTAILNFLNSEQELQRLHISLNKEKAKPTDNGTFFVDEMNMLDASVMKSIVPFWRARQTRNVSLVPGDKNVCIATGVFTNTVSTTERIKGIPGGLTTGTNFISFDKDSFCSYGLEQAQNAALSVAAELRIRSALNQLVAESRAEGLVFEEVIVIHWTRAPIDMDPLNVLSGADEEAITHLLKSVKSGEEGYGIEDNTYYASSLSGNGARVVVRDWIESTVPDVMKNVAQWFEDLSIISSDASRTKRDFNFRTLLLSLVRAELEELPPAVSALLFHAALKNSPLTHGVLAAAIRRQQLDQEDKINSSRLALIKACLIRTQKENNQMKPELNSESTEPAYICGRLFAVFERLQFMALGDVNGGPVERLYASASVTPSLVMGRLFRMAHFHLAKVSGVPATNIEKDFESLSDLIGPRFPELLDLEGQGRFALGFYHQKAEYRRRSNERKEKGRKPEETAQ